MQSYLGGHKDKLAAQSSSVQGQRWGWEGRNKWSPKFSRKYN